MLSGGRGEMAELPSGEQDLAQVAAEQQGHRVANRCPHRAALDDSVGDRLNPAVHDDHVRRLAGRGRALVAEGDADVGQPDRRCVVGAVAGDRDHMAGAAQRSHDRDLVRRADPGEDCRLGHQRVKVRLVGLVQVGTGDHGAAVEEVEFGSDRLGRARVVAGQHDHLHARAAQPSDCLGRGWAYRVGQSKQASQLEPVHALVIEIPPPRRRPFGDREYPQTLMCQAVHFGLDLVAVMLGQGPGPPGAAPGGRIAVARFRARP